MLRFIIAVSEVTHAVGVTKGYSKELIICLFLRIVRSYIQYRIIALTDNYCQYPQTLRTSIHYHIINL